MTKGLTSIIVPSRSPEFLQKTVDDLLLKAEGNIEIIIVLDGIWPEKYNWSDKRIRVIHQGTIHNSLGMRAAINTGVALAEGEYLLKCDEHTLWDKGYDKKLIVESQDNTMQVPRRYRLDADNWKIVEDGRDPVDYMYLEYPYLKPYDKTQGLHGNWDKQRYYDRKDILIDDLMTMQGSCYFLPRKLWDSVIVEMDNKNYHSFTAEAQELSNKIWLSGNRVVVNKNTWIAHLHKGGRGRRYGFSNEQYRKHEEGMERGRLYCIDFWVNNKWDKRVHDFEWLIEKFWPVPGWPEDWKTRIHTDKKLDYSTLKYKDDPWLSGLRTE
ncbi:MAG: hypothetical protein US60_C0051G0002 [Microgenomates group bacterium GW2011_GWC1_37_8]|nr:MAG: hypothetical protein US60_C0051G0002 [Microgenomates group bacterium GW2011_GWC1_37_8]